MNLKSRFILERGSLLRKDNSLCFENSMKSIHIPIAKTDEIFALNEISINTKVLGLLSKYGITLHIFDYYCNYRGSFYPAEIHSGGSMLIKQVEAFDSRILIAKNIVTGIATNIVHVLYHYYRHGINGVKEFIDELNNDVLQQISDCSSVEQVMAVEGKIWNRFYDTFPKIIKSEYKMEKRTRRPPTDPLNSLISFGNSILYSKTLSQIYQTSLNPTISYLHTPMDRRLSLSLDIAEVFKPIIVYKVIFDCINHNKLSIEKHFDFLEKSCFLNKSGKKIFIEEIMKKFQETFYHLPTKHEISYLTAIKYDVYKLAKFISEGKEFIPFDERKKY